jgi:hypothetical protein
LKWIKQNRHIVVGKYIFASGQMSANPGWLTIAADESEIECAFCMPQPDFGVFRARIPIARCDLGEAGEFEQLVFQLGPKSERLTPSASKGTR